MLFRSEDSHASLLIPSKESPSSFVNADIGRDATHLKSKDLIQPESTQSAASVDDLSNVACLLSTATVELVLPITSINRDAQSSSIMNGHTEAQETAAPSIDLASTMHGVEALARPSPVERATGGGDELDSRFSGPAPADSSSALYDDPASFRTGVEAATRDNYPPPSREAADKGSIPVDPALQVSKSDGGSDVKVAGESSEIASNLPTAVSSSAPDIIARDSSAASLPSSAVRDEYEDSVIVNDANARNLAQ